MSTTPQDRIAALARAPLFADLTQAQLASLASRVKTRTYRAGEIVFHKDDPGFTFHIIHSGLVRIYVTSPEGQEVVLIILKPGDFFGELSLFDGAPPALPRRWPWRPPKPSPSTVTASSTSSSNSLLPRSRSSP